MPSIKKCKSLYSTIGKNCNFLRQSSISSKLSFSRLKPNLFHYFFNDAFETAICKLRWNSWANLFVFVASFLVRLVYKKKRNNFYFFLHQVFHFFVSCFFFIVMYSFNEYSNYITAVLNLKSILNPIYYLIFQINVSN